VTADYRELVIEDLSSENATLRAEIVELDTDAAVYRELALATFDALRDLTLRHDRLLADRDRLRDENRRLREDRLIAAGATDDADHGAAA